MYSVIYTIAIFALVGYLFYSWHNPKLVYVRSNVDNNTYIVRNESNKHEAADLIATVNMRLEDLVLRLKKKYGNSDSRVNLLEKRFKNHEIRESIPRLNQTSYSLNKGERIVLCIRARNNTKKLIDLNTITFVALHELAHIMTISIGHKKEFWENFKFILAHAIKWKIYNSVDYNKKPKPYCGIKITDSPLIKKDMGLYLS
tara:strand:- start:15980 stop:16582 length:603 start_codon:yes stop_codon:yes gene_type:complete